MKRQALRLLLVINRPPYDGTDVAWNALRLANTAMDRGHYVRLFLINDGVDLARPSSRPSWAEFDLCTMLADTIGRGAEVRLCQTCLTRCGIGDGDIISGAQVAGMQDLVEWIETSDRVLSF